MNHRDETMELIFLLIIGQLPQMAFHELSRDDRWAKPGHRIEPAGLLSTLTNGLYKVLVINEDKQINVL